MELSRGARRQQRADRHLTPKLPNVRYLGERAAGNPLPKMFHLGGPKKPNYLLIVIFPALIGIVFSALAATRRLTVFSDRFLESYQGVFVLVILGCSGLVVLALVHLRRAILGVTVTAGSVRLFSVRSGQALELDAERIGQIVVVLKRKRFYRLSQGVEPTKYFWDREPNSEAYDLELYITGLAAFAPNGQKIGLWKTGWSAGYGILLPNKLREFGYDVEVHER